MTKIFSIRRYLSSPFL